MLSRRRPPDRRRAVALTYDDRDAAAGRAPRVVAKGEGLLAERIIDEARAAGVILNRSPELAALLYQVDLEAQIPPALYLAVAEVLAWVYRVEQQGWIEPHSAPGTAQLTRD